LRVERGCGLKREELLGQVDDIAPVAVGDRAERGARLGSERQLAALGGLRALDERLERGVSSRRRTRTWQRESRAALSSKEGFSVVAPTSVTVPSST